MTDAETLRLSALQWNDHRTAAEQGELDELIKKANAKPAPMAAKPPLPQPAKPVVPVPQTFKKP
jgi:sugar (pentulose or hexulose) kinase